jgi:hypothetical protein
MSDRGNINALKTIITNIWKTNNRQEITGPVGGSTLHDIVDTLGNLIQTSGKLIQYSVNLNAGVTRINVGLTADKIIVIGRYAAESATKFQSGRLTLSITGGSVYVIFSDTFDNNQGNGIGLDITGEIDSVDTSKVNLVLNNTSGDILIFTYSLYQADATLQGAGVTSINGQTGAVNFNEIPITLIAFPSNGAISLAKDCTGYNSKTVTAPLTITPATGAIEGGTAYGVIIADGTNVPDITAFSRWDYNDYVNTNGVSNHWYAARKNGINIFRWNQLP